VNKLECTDGAVCFVDVSGCEYFDQDNQCKDAGTFCDVNCEGVSNCSLDCFDNADCILRCAGASTCDFIDCDGDVLSCPGDILACNTDCP
jgi:hypothetical protein